jgi:hypothetical protein
MQIIRIYPKNIRFDFAGFNEQKLLEKQSSRSPIASQMKNFPNKAPGDTVQYRFKSDSRIHINVEYHPTRPFEPLLFFNTGFFYVL